MLTNIALLLVACLSILIGVKLFARRSSERTRCDLPELAGMVADELATRRQGAILRASHEQDATLEFCFLKGEDTGTARQNVLFALIEPAGRDMGLDLAVEALNKAGIALEVRHSRTRRESARVLAVPMQGSPDQLAREVRRIVTAILEDSHATGEAAFDVTLFGRADRGIRARVESAYAPSISGPMQSHRLSER